MSPAMPLVSVCVISYNQIDFIAEALDSVIAQSYRPLEVIVLDDASTDGTADVIADRARRHPELIRVLPAEPHRGLAGLAAALNAAIRSCRGTYLACLEGDDVYLPEKIAAQVAWFEESPQRVLCGHDVEIFNVLTRQTRLASEAAALRTGRGAGPLLRHGCPPFLSVSMMVRMSAVPARGFDERIALGRDSKFCLDCLSGGGTFGHVDGVLARYRRHAANVTNADPTLFLDDWARIVELTEAEHPHLGRDCRHARAYLDVKRCAYQTLTGQPRIARRRLARALVLAPELWFHVIVAAVLSCLPTTVARSISTRLGVFRSPLPYV